MTDELDENVFEVMDDLRGDNRVAVPDVGTIHRRAKQKQNRMRAVAGAACLTVIAAAGVGVWASLDDSSASTDTAGVDEAVENVDKPPTTTSESVPVEPETTEDHTPVDIVTGEPEGSRGMNALSSFTLQYDPELNCLYHDEPNNNGEPGTGGRVVIVWPAEYSAAGDTQGVVVVHNSIGDVVARSGETFQIGGGMRTGGADHCDSIGTWIANGGPRTGNELGPVAPTTTIADPTTSTTSTVASSTTTIADPTTTTTLAPSDEPTSAFEPLVMTLQTAEGDLQLNAYTFCGNNFCADGSPSEPYLHAGEVPGKITFTFPHPNWEFSVHSGVDIQVIEIEPMLYEITISGPPRTRTLNVSGEGEEGSLAARFRLDNVGR